MSEHANTELVQLAYQKFKAGDIQGFQALLAVDVQWLIPEMPNVPFAGSRQGREKVGKFFGLMAAFQDVVEFEPEEFIAQDNKVVVLGRFAMHVKATNRIVRSAWVHVWAVDGGKVISMREYVDTLAVSRAHTS